MYVHVRDENGMLIKTFILTRSHYYERAKINAIVRRSNRYNTTNMEMKALIDGLSEHHFKTACESHHSRRRRFDPILMGDSAPISSSRSWLFSL